MPAFMRYGGNKKSLTFYANVFIQGLFEENLNGMRLDVVVDTCSSNKKN